MRKMQRNRLSLTNDNIPLGEALLAVVLADLLLNLILQPAKKGDRGQRNGRHVRTNQRGESPTFILHDKRLLVASESQDTGNGCVSPTNGRVGTRIPQQNALLPPARGFMVARGCGF